MGNETLKVFLLLLLCTTSAFSLPSLEFDEHILRIIRSGDIDGYDIATVQAVDSATNEERGQTKRDIEVHATDPSSGERRFSLLLTSGKRLRMSLARHSIDTSGTIFTTLTEEGEREITFRQARDCFFGGELEGEEGYASLAMCGGQMMGSVSTVKRTYEIHSLSRTESERTAPDDVINVLVTWHEGAGRERGVQDGIEIPRDVFPTAVPDDDNGAGRERGLQDGIEIPRAVFDTTLPDDNNVTAIERSVADRKVTIEIADFVDKYFIQTIGNVVGRTTDENIIDYILYKWSKVHQSLSNVKRVGWDITLRLVKLTLWRKSPSWYRTSRSDTLMDRMDMVCRGTEAGKYDQVTLHTSQNSDSIRIGLAYVGGICAGVYRCAAVTFSSYDSNTELHEFGHSMGLRHDAEISGCSKEGEGFMGYSFKFLKCYKKPLNTFFQQRDTTCVYEDNNPNTVKIFK